MRRWVLRLYPRPIRRRHGDEIADLLERSPRPVRDALDVAAHAGRAHLEVLMSRPLRLGLDAATGALLVAFGFVLNDLEHGLTEIPRHWWSSLALLAVAVGVVVRSTLLRREDGSPDRDPLASAE